MVKRRVILVVDDEKRMLNFLSAELKALDYDVTTAAEAEAALRIIEERSPSLVLLDIMLTPDGPDGIALLERIRQTSAVPVILLSARDSAAEKVRGLHHGADDYLTKPFNPEELAARMEAVLRRCLHGAAQSLDRLTVGALTVDFNQRRVERHGRRVDLSRTEWQLLMNLAATPGRVLLHEELLARTWGPEFRNDLQYLRVWISRLRHKLEDDPATPRLIRTAPGIGYMLETAPDAPLTPAAVPEPAAAPERQTIAP
ncbi:MAG: response regulator transcription factor [Chloroflexi bacterium]|nr:response regulator transcription factor [Chloroflexota bacterium]